MRLGLKMNNINFLNPLIIFDNDDLQISILYRDSQYVNFCFSGVGHGIGGIELQTLEFRNATKNATAIFIIDKNRSWGNNIDFELIYKVTSKYTQDKILNTLGNSMGGFLSILATKYLPVQTCIAFVPQYSVNKNVVPFEYRWKKYVSKIKKWKYESLEGFFNRKSLYYIFFGADGGIEDQQRNLFPKQENVHLIIFNNPDFAHKVAGSLKALGELYPVIEACFEQRDVHSITKDILKNHKLYNH